jgi:hypothetical protein
MAENVTELEREEGWREIGEGFVGVERLQEWVKDYFY